MDPFGLVGAWTLARRVVDRTADSYGSVTGELVVTADGDGVRLAESGVLHWQGGRYPVTRVSLLRPLNGEWWMFFDDGRPFHPWRPGSPVVHPCGADTYRGLVALDRDGTRLRTLWDVHGPAKDQRLITRFTRH
ncbi:DUF6314 family protein [Cryptosporangium aurantiacum]|uniref:DUF6314 domain-containing protein n=1 Tax=Cryptosporangium aurantiacum TaxID=134849 RepID=A0A1M7RL01_9ACTN|nr:DUF6314 family protein [Cryptosporangium aurantiacum]SHN46987.1 hypothetical protein SAMN05443668_11983 [Cryptosporangium aurantiacum]